MKSTSRRWIASLLAVAALALALRGSGGAHLASDGQGPPDVGEVAPPLGSVHWKTSDRDGAPADLAALRSHVVLVHTWGYYCDP